MHIVFPLCCPNSIFVPSNAFMQFLFFGTTRKTAWMQNSDLKVRTHLGGTEQRSMRAARALWRTCTGCAGSKFSRENTASSTTTSSSPSSVFTSTRSTSWLEALARACACNPRFGSSQRNINILHNSPKTDPVMGIRLGVVLYRYKIQDKVYVVESF